MSDEERKKEGKGDGNRPAPEPDPPESAQSDDPAAAPPPAPPAPAPAPHALPTEEDSAGDPHQQVGMQSITHTCAKSCIFVPNHAYLRQLAVFAPQAVCDRFIIDILAPQAYCILRGSFALRGSCAAGLNALQCLAPRVCVSCAAGLNALQCLAPRVCVSCAAGLNALQCLAPRV